MKYTEEVNKAIEAMKDKLDNDENSWFYYDEIETIFDLLEKQNKEIEKLKEHLNQYYDGKLFTANQLKAIEREQNKSFIHKDKIRRKIKELENQKVSIKVGFEKIFEAKMDNAKIIDTLRELLRGE